MSKISVSQINILDECHRKWYYRYVEKIPGEVPEAFKFGGNVHKMIEARLKRTQPKISQKSFEYSNNAHYDFKKAEHLVHNGLKKLDEIVGSWEGAVEPKNVELRLSNNFFTAIIDLLIHDYNGEYYLIDWKTTSQAYDNHRIKTDRQLTAYAWMCQEQIGFIPDHVCFVTLNKKSNEAIAYITERTQDDINEFKKIAQEKYKLIQIKPNDRNPDSCITKWGVCAFYNKCWDRKDPRVLQNDLPNLRQSTRICK